jgi:hypothetical protein
MPSYPQVVRFHHVCQKLLGVRGGSMGVCVDDLYPMIPVVAPDDPTLRFLRDEYQGLNFAYQAAVAGNYGYTAIVCPSGSSKLLVIDRVSLYRQTAGNVYLMNSGSYAVGERNNLPRDFRMSGQAFQTGSAKGNQAGTGAATDPFIYTSASWVDVPELVGVVLVPGSALTFLSATVNDAIAHKVSFYERDFTIDELVM